MDVKKLVDVGSGIGGHKVETKESVKLVFANSRSRIQQYQELKPCPFCGGEAWTHRSEPLGGMVAECMLATSGLCIGNGRVSADLNKSIRYWNRRASGWISVEDRLPKTHGDRFLVKVAESPFNNAGIEISTFSDLILPCWGHERVHADKVTHWMPLPAAPEVKHETN